MKKFSMWRALKENGVGHRVTFEWQTLCGINLDKHYAANRKRPYCKKCAAKVGQKP